VTPARPVLVWGLTSLAVAAALHLVLEPASDTAYYLGWSRFPALGYLDHPGGVAWLALPFPDGALRTAAWLLPLLVAAGHVWIVAGFVAQVGSLPDRQSRSAAGPPYGGNTLGVALFASPLWVGGALLWTPDCVFLAAWHGGLLVLLSRRRLYLLVPLAFVLVAFKLSGLWLVLVWVVAAWRRDRIRALLGTEVARSEPSRVPTRDRRWLVASLLAAFAALLLTGRSSLEFQLQRLADGGGGDWLGGLELFALLGAQVALVGLPLALGLGWLVWRSRGAKAEADGRQRLLATCAVGAAVPFLLVGLFSHVEANWLAPMLLPAVGWGLLRARGAGLQTARPLRAAAAGQGVMLLLLASLALPQVGPRLGAADPFAQLRGWSSWSRALPPAELVLADRYQLAAQHALYSGAVSATFDALAPGAAKRPGALDGLVDLRAERVVLLWQDREPPAAAVERWPVACVAGVLATPSGGPPRETYYVVRASKSEGCE